MRMPPSGFKIGRVEARLFRTPIKTARKAPYGSQAFRSALLVKLTDTDGVVGWGEAFANWPPFGGEHRQRIVDELLAPIACGASYEHPAALMDRLEAQTAIPRIKADEPGPFAQGIAAIDIAAWDIVARRSRLPLHALLGDKGQALARVPLYASGITPETVAAAAEAGLRQGISRFKLKVGFGSKADREAVLKLRELTQGQACLMADADQAWRPEEAPARIAELADLGLAWMEEPIRADEPVDVWQALASRSPIGLAAGENLRGLASFAEMIGSGVLGFIQPDVIKWGGISRVLEVARMARSRGVRFCPHYLGSGLGLIATAHLLVATGSAEALEYDVSENPLRELSAVPFPTISEGHMMLTDAPGLGVAPDLESLGAFVM
jgi:L-alanine-DL-glutamate epimerase-like enolase superfamily enzyme